VAADLAEGGIGRDDGDGAGGGEWRRVQVGVGRSEKRVERSWEDGQVAADLAEGGIGRDDGDGAGGGERRRVQVGVETPGKHSFWRCWAGKRGYPSGQESGKLSPRVDLGCLCRISSPAQAVAPGYR